jgi:hypothetical protein
MLTLATTAPLTATGKICVGPVQPEAFVSVTETVSLEVPKETVIEFVFCPAVMLAVPETVQVYVEPVVFVTE